MRKYALLKMAYKFDIKKRSLLFFTPTEELHGANIFSKLANQYSIISPYLELIDEDFIKL